jgi:hypothetical protein
MEKDKPFRVRKAAYDVILAARDGWLRSAELRPTLEDLDFPRKLHSVVIETGRSDFQVSFLEMMEILSEDRYWHPYLRKAMDIWLPFHHEGRDQVLRILTTVGELLPPGHDGSNGPSLDKSLDKVVEDEWAGVPGRLPMDLTADRLEPLAEVTKQFKELFFTESNRKAVLAAVERVIPALEKRRDDGYEGPGEDVRGIVDDLLGTMKKSLMHAVAPSYALSLYFVSRANESMTVVSHWNGVLRYGVGTPSGSCGVHSYSDSRSSTFFEITFGILASVTSKVFENEPDAVWM